RLKEPRNDLSEGAPLFSLEGRLLRNRAEGELAGRSGLETIEEKPLAQHLVKGILAVDDARHAGQEADLPGPLERLGVAPLLRVAPVVHLAELGKDLGALLSVHREHAAEVLHHEDLAGELGEQARLRALLLEAAG